MKLGTYPSRRYSHSWVTQRLLNRAPEWSHARQSTTAVAQQVLNPVGRDIQDVLQQLNRERYNMFVTTADMNMLDLLYYVELPTSMEFTTTELAPGAIAYTAPRVYAMINNIEYEISIAEENSIRTLWDEALPTRIEYAEQSEAFNTVISTLAGDLSDVTPNNPCIEGHLYIMLSDNSNWETRTLDHVYYSKVAITGTTQKGIDLTEVVPLRRNDIFKTVHRWKSVSEVRVSYVSDTATITIGSFPFDQTSPTDGHIPDERNLIVPREGGERRRFMRLGSQSWGSSLISESYTVSEADEDLIRKGIDSLEIEYEIELLDSAGSNVTLDSMVLQPNTNYVYAIDNTKFYIYDYNMPYPDTDMLIGESVDTHIVLHSDRWAYSRGSIATIKTYNMDLTSPPHSFRWTLIAPSGAEYFVDLDGTLLPTSTVDAWNDNLDREDSYWDEQAQAILLNEQGTYVLVFEYRHYNEDTHEFTTTSTRSLLFVPAIHPEAVLNLPAQLQQCTDIAWDSDGYLWFYKDDFVYQSNICYDYFLADYATRKIWLRENYSSVRVVV